MQEHVQYNSHSRSALFNLLAPRISHLLREFRYRSDTRWTLVTMQSGRIIRGFGDTYKEHVAAAMRVSHTNDERKLYFRHLTTATIFESSTKLEGRMKIFFSCRFYNYGLSYLIGKYIRVEPVLFKKILHFKNIIINNEST